MSELSRDRIMEMFREEKAILDGHFLLSSGLHSPRYMQCARVLSSPPKAELLGRAIAEKTAGHGIEAVISPAMGGLIIGHETARALGVRHIFAERVEGRMSLRRGFEIVPGERFLAVEDVLTTGGSIMEVMEMVKSLGGLPVAAASIVLRGDLSSAFGVPLSYLLEFRVPAYPPGECPICKSGAAPPVKPGSKGNY